ncbi:hypothetical protein AB0D38_45215, partial [Streptomyces sp. NPDC048279]
MTTPPPDPEAAGGCPAAHGTGVTRLYGPDAAMDPLAVHERLRARYGAVAPVLLEGDVPAWWCPSGSEQSS